MFLTLFYHNLGFNACPIMVQLNGLTYRMEEEKVRDYGSIIL